MIYRYLTNFHLVNYRNNNEYYVVVIQCTFSGNRLNICTVIFHYIQSQPQKISSNKTEITNFPLYCLLQQQFVEDNIKADIKFIYFLRTICLFFVGF